MPQPLPQQFGAPQDSRTGHPDGRDPVVWAAGTLRFFVKSDCPHDGQAGLSCPRISSSNSWPQAVQVYS